MGLKYDADAIINNSYLHVLTIDGKPENVKSYMLNTIKYQLLWSTSKSHKDEQLNSTDKTPSDNEDVDDLKDKIIEDQQYSVKRAIIEIRRREITDQIDRIVFEAYIDKGYVTARSMATYFDIPVTSAHNLIKDIKQNLTEIQYRYETFAIY